MVFVHVAPGDDGAVFEYFAGGVPGDAGDFEGSAGGLAGEVLGFPLA